jgi:hypothetical protein
MLEQPSISARVQDKAEVDHLHREVINQSNRLLCGSAYRRGLLSGLGLLRRLRSDPYKSKSPEANLDLDQIATHANQAVIYTLLFSLWALGTPITAGLHGTDIIQQFSVIPRVHGGICWRADNILRIGLPALGKCASLPEVLL